MSSRLGPTPLSRPLSLFSTRPRGSRVPFSESFDACGIPANLPPPPAGLSLRHRYATGFRHRCSGVELPTPRSTCLTDRHPRSVNFKLIHYQMLEQLGLEP